MNTEDLKFLIDDEWFKIEKDCGLDVFSVCKLRRQLHCRSVLDTLSALTINPLKPSYPDKVIQYDDNHKTKVISPATKELK